MPFGATGPAAADVGLEVICADRLAVVEILDEGLDLLKTGIGEARGEFKPGFYRLRSVAPGGRISRRLVYLRPGQEIKTVFLDAPGAAQPLYRPVRVRPGRAMLDRLGWAAHEVLLELSGTRRRMREGGLGLLRVEGHPSAGLNVHTWNQGEARPQGLRLLSRVRLASPGHWWVQLNSRALDCVLSAVVLPGRDTIITIDPHNPYGEAMYASLGGFGAEAGSTEFSFRKQRLAQAFCQSGRFDLALSYAGSLREEFHHDPLAGCLFCYLLLRMGLASDDRFRSLAAVLMERFPGLSDAHLLWAEYASRGRESSAGAAAARPGAEAESGYLRAAQSGVPIFAEGFIRLASACRRILEAGEVSERATAGRRIPQASETDLRRMVALREFLVRGPLFTTFRSDAFEESNRGR